MKYLYLPLSFMAFTFTACNAENDLKLQKGTVVNQSSNQNTGSNTLMENLPSNNLPIQTVSNTNLPPNANTTNSNVKLNPEHGQPGHRCEIAVGAPLNSEPTSSNNVPSNPILINPANTPAAAPVKMSPMSNSALNPEHGQPGHRCEIAVGAPLNSVPNNAQNATPSIKETSSPLQMQKGTPPNITPAPIIKTAPNPNAKINPEHGQPGHKCEVAVGSPLPE